MKYVKKEVSNAFTVDIEVEDTHSYQLENGIISHNTLSLLGGATPGGHPGYSLFHMRTVRMSSEDKLVTFCREAGYKIEYALNFDGTEKRDTVVVYFPTKFDSGTKVAKDVTAIEQLEILKKLQTEWSDNAVSITVYYKKEELNDIKSWLRDNYNNSVKSVSFLLHSDHGFKQAPYIEITEDEYLKAIKKIKPISTLISKNNIAGNVLEGIECAGGSCPIK